MKCQQNLANTESTSNSSSNKTTASPTPFVPPPSTLLPAVNLEKGKMALSQGEHGTAWAHLSEIPKKAKEYASAKELLARIPEREQIEFELAELDGREANLNNAFSGLAYRIKPPELAREADRLEKVLRGIQARRYELNRRLEKMP